MTQFNDKSPRTEMLRIQTANGNVVKVSDMTKWYCREFHPYNGCKNAVRIQFSQKLTDTENGRKFIDELTLFIETNTDVDIVDYYETKTTFSFFVVDVKLHFVIYVVKTFCDRWES